MFLILFLLIEAYPAMTSIGAAIGAPMIYDFIKTAFKRATGSLDAEPQTTSLSRVYQRAEPPPLKRHPVVDFDELAEVLEGSLQAAHRPIGGEGTIQTISIGSPRHELVAFNDVTKDWVNTREEGIGLEVVRGNVTRYNSQSRNSRVYVDQLGRIIPMRPDSDFDTGSLPLLTWSLHGSNIGSANKLDMRVRRISSASGKVKRLLLSDCSRSPSN